MKKESIYEYYFFGTCVRYLQDAEVGFPIKEEGCVLQNIGCFLDMLDVLNLTVTKRLSADLVAFRGELKTVESDASLTKKQAKRLKDIMDELRNPLDAEIHERHAFIVMPKIIDVTKLLDNIESLFAPDVFDELPEIAKYDFGEAGKCIAFERPTAAAFHTLRGTESMLRKYYCTLIKQKRVSQLLWGEMVKDLRSRPKTKNHVTLYNNLDNIRLSFRNPTQHPEKVYDIHETQDLWSLCVEAVNRMVKTLSLK